jgi:hypothetical protein
MPSTDDAAFITAHIAMHLHVWLNIIVMLSSRRIQCRLRIHGPAHEAGMHS